MGDGWAQGANEPSLVLGEPVQPVKGSQGEGMQAVCSLPGCCDPLEHVLSSGLSPGAGKSVGWPYACHPQLQEESRKGSQQPLLWEMRGFILPDSLKVTAFMDFGNQCYGLCCSSAELCMANAGGK